MTTNPTETDALEAEQAQAEKSTAEHQGNDTPSAADIADELRYAPLANLRGRSESTEANALVHRLAEPDELDDEENERPEFGPRDRAL